MRNDKIYKEMLQKEPAEVWNILRVAITVLRDKKEMRTLNILGELGEHDAVRILNEKRGLHLRLLKESTKHIDAIDDETQKTYSVKSASNGQTGTFSSIQFDKNGKPIERAFDYLVICKYDKKNTYQLNEIYILSWERFLELKSWHSTMKSYKISITKKFRAQLKPEEVISIHS